MEPTTKELVRIYDDAVLSQLGSKIPMEQRINKGIRAVRDAVIRGLADELERPDRDHITIYADCGNEHGVDVSADSDVADWLRAHLPEYDGGPEYALYAEIGEALNEASELLGGDSLIPLAKRIVGAVRRFDSGKGQVA